MRLKYICLIAVAGIAFGQAPKTYTVKAGTRIPLGLINSVSSKHSSEGDKVYLETVYPIVLDGKVVIPTGSHVDGTVTSVKRPGRVKGRGELYIRFDTLILPNGVTREFRSRMESLDAAGNGKVDKNEGVVRGDSNKGGDARTVAETTGSGASIGAIAGGAAGHMGMGAGLGAAAGAAAGLVGVLASRGPDAILPKGTTVEMVLDREISFAENEVNFSGALPSAAYSAGPAPEPAPGGGGQGGARHFPF